MDTIDTAVLVRAGKHVDECRTLGDVHTVILVTDGATGGALLTVEGSLSDGEEFRRQFCVGGNRDGEAVALGAGRSYQ